MKPISRSILRGIAAMFLTTHAVIGGTVGRPDLDQLKTPIYTVEGTAIVRHNGDRYSNRPLYCNQTAGVVIGGDRPLLMFGGGKTRYGTFIIGLLREGHLQWAHLASDITMKYTPDQLVWVVGDKSWGDTQLELTVVPPADGTGLALRGSIKSAHTGDKLVWLSGAAVREKQTVLNTYDVTTAGRQDRMLRGFDPDDCDGNVITISGQTWTQSAERAEDRAVGSCSEVAKLTVIKATDWQALEKNFNQIPDAGSGVPRRAGLNVTKPGSSGNLRTGVDGKSSEIEDASVIHPICCGVIDASKSLEVYWSIGVGFKKARTSPNAKDDFLAGLNRVQQIARQVTVDTPDPWLNAAVPASCAVMDGVFRDGIYTHAGMRWGVPLLGWRTTFGATAYGWHDRVLQQARSCIASQITESDKTKPIADPATLLASQSAQSRLFGVGRIKLYQPNHYDMQSQFFDQLLYAWRSTGNAELEKLLKPSLDLHLQYLRDCFDPQGLGIYESYANTWPTDDQWYNGGGTSEETAYAYRGHRDALLIAQRAHDDVGIQLHQAAMDQIRKAFFDLLWVKDTGHPGAYREQGGLRRLHNSAWLYAIFCPIDAGLLDQQQSAQALDYTEWGLERMKMPYGGEQCWPSNWVPSIWSLREIWPGDDYHLALAYYQTGLADQGWSLLHGTFPQQMFFGSVPGDLGHPAGATDFNDCASMFCRTVVEGLFGYVPDYPNHRVTMIPDFPQEWDHAEITTPDFSEKFSQCGMRTDLAVTLTKPADLLLRIPVSTTKVINVTVDGKPASCEVVPGFGQSLIQVTIANCATANVEVTTVDRLGTFPPVHMNVNRGDGVRLKADHARIDEWSDPQAVLNHPDIEDDDLSATVSGDAGNHLVFALCKAGNTRQWRLFKLHIRDLAAERAADAAVVHEVPKSAKWETIDIKPQFNGDIRTIYQQKYLSPRPDTCSLRLASDGYSTWQMALSPKNKPPAIDLGNLAGLRDASGRIASSEGALFSCSDGAANIAFTSQWDNWPRTVDIPVKRSGDALWFLISGTTNPMEVQIANAQLDIVYTDGQTQTLELIPPFNFWSICPLQSADYDYHRDGFALPAVPPSQVDLGNNCRAIVLNQRLRPGAVVDHVTLKALSQQSVIGIMALSVMNPG